MWFKKLEEIGKAGGQSAVDDLKTDLTGNTLIGEYVGSQEH